MNSEESYRFPSYTKAVSILLSLASRVFKAAMAEAGAESEAFEHWYVLRRVAQCWLNNHSTQMCTAEREALKKALRFVHEQAHRDVPFAVERFQDCSCETSRRLADLALLQVADATGVEIPIPGVAA